MKPISEKNYYYITLGTLLVIGMITIIIVRTNNRSQANVATIEIPRLPEAVITETDLPVSPQIDEIDIFAQEDR